MPAITPSGRKQVHSLIYFLSLCVLVMAMPYSRYIATLSLIFLIVNWVSEGNLGNRLKVFAADRAALAFTLMYAVNLAGLAWSDNPGFGISNDLLHKSPTLFLPLILVTTPLPGPRRIKILIWLFIGAVTAVSFAGLLIRIIKPMATWRDASPFIPGVYYGNLLLLAAFQVPLLLRKMKAGKKALLAGAALSAWLIFFLFYTRTLTGIASLAGVILYIHIILIARIRSLALKGSIALAAIILLAIATKPVIDIYRETHHESENGIISLKTHTAAGNPYSHDTTSVLRENGNLVYIDICDLELSEAWAGRSSLDYEGLTTESTHLKSVLLRYMASRNLTKDAEGLGMLSDEDIEAVENGFTNYLNVSRPGVYVRIYEELRGLYLYREVGYQHGLPSSFTERIDQWRAALQAFRAKPWFGWGTGSIFTAMNYGFEKNGSILAGSEMKSHNQYLYIMINTGIAGLVSYIILYTFFVIRSGVGREVMFKIFLLTFLINFLANNSYESQLGQNPFVFFSLFYCYFYPFIEGKTLKDAVST